MPEMGTWLALFGGIATAAQIAGRIYGKARSADKDIDVRRDALRQLSARGRETAKAILKIKREMRSLEAEAANASTNAEKLEETVTRLENQARQLYVLEDTRAPDDKAFVIRVFHANFERITPEPPRVIAKAWKAGRAYLVWGADADKAAAKARLRFKTDRGYAVSAPTEFDGDLSLI